MTKNNIIIVALRLFLSRGYKYVSLVDVANKAGITKGAIYHYFTSKEELLNETVECLLDHLTAKVVSMFSDQTSLYESLNELIVNQVVEKYIDDVLGIEQEIFQDNRLNFMLEAINHFPHIRKRIEQDIIKICDAISRRLQKAIYNEEIRSDLNVNALTMILFTILQGQRQIDKRLEDQNMRKNIVRMLCMLMGIDALVPCL